MIASFPHGLLATSLFLSLVIALFLPLRPLLRRGIGSQWLCALWLIFLIRLLIPLPLETRWGLINRWSNIPAATAETPGQWKFSVTYPHNANRDDASNSLPPRAPGSPATSRTTMRIDIPLAIWLAGLFASVALLATRRRQTRLLAARALPATDPRLLSLYSSIPANLRRNVILRETDAVHVPTLSGIFRPQIWMPRSWLAQFSDDELRRILLHELGHARRGDLSVQWLFALAQCLHWFNPLVWLAARAAQLDREMACDAWVLARHCPGDSHAYGATLLKTVQLLRVPICAPTATVAMASSRQNLRTRIAGIGAFRPTRRWPGLLATAAMLATLALLTTSAQTPSSTSTPSPSATDSQSAVADSDTPAIIIEPKIVEIRESAWKDLCAQNTDLQRIAAAFQPEGATAGGKPPDPDSAAALDAVAPGKWELKADAWQLYSKFDLLASLTGAQFQSMLESFGQSKDASLFSAPSVTIKDQSNCVIRLAKQISYPPKVEAAANKIKPEADTASQKDVGLDFSINPRLNSDGTIALKMDPEMSSFLGYLQEKDGKKAALTLPAAVTAPGLLWQPILSTSRGEFNTSIPSGHTLLLGAFRMDNPTDQLDFAKQWPNPDKWVTGNEPPAERRILLIFVTAKASLHPMPESYKVLAVNSGWKPPFVVLGYGSLNGAIAGTEMILVRRDRQIAKVKIATVEGNTSVADVIPGSLVSADQLKTDADAIPFTTTPETIDYWESVLAKDPTSWKSHNHIGALLYMQGEINDAYPHFLKTVQLNPDFPEGHNNLGLVLSYMKQTDAAIGQFQAALKLKDESPIDMNLANAYEQANRFDDAIKVYRHTIQLNPDNASAHLNLGYSLMRQGKVGDAIAEFRKAKELDPNMPQAENDLEQALRIYNKENTLQPPQPTPQ